MIDPEHAQMLEPVQAEPSEAPAERWAYWFVVFLRMMAGLSLIKGLYHWAVVCGIGAPSGAGFEAYSTPYQVATVFFAVIDLVAAVGLWLAAPWGAVVWLTAVISMAAVEALFPQIYGGSILVMLIEIMLLVAYLGLTLMAARAQQA
jgi:hypothetical protein